MFNIATKKRLKLNKQHVRDLSPVEVGAVGGAQARPAPPSGFFPPPVGTGTALTTHVTCTFTSFQACSDLATIGSAPSACLCVPVPPPPLEPLQTQISVCLCACDGVTLEHTRMLSCTCG